MIKCTKKQIRELRTVLRWKIPEAQRQRIQMVLLREGGMTQPAIAAAMGVSLSTVNRAHMAFDQGGIKALKPKPIGGRQRENMMVAEEKALLARFARAAGAGEMLIIHELKAAYEKAIGHETSNSTIYNLLAWHGWRKLMPRPFHPKRDIAAQNAFKKRVPQCCQESPAGCRQAWPSLAHHVRPARLFRGNYKDYRRAAIDSPLQRRRDAGHCIVSGGALLQEHVADRARRARITSKVLLNQPRPHVLFPTRHERIDRQVERVTRDDSRGADETVFEPPDLPQHIVNVADCF
jgi:transposase